MMDRMDGWMARWMDDGWMMDGCETAQLRLGLEPTVF